MGLFACKLKIIWALQVSLLQSNIANVNTTRTPEGGAYKRQYLECTDISKCQIIFEENIALKYEPDHPDSNSDGYVEYPNINMSQELENLIVAEKAFETTELKCAQSLY